MVDKLLKYSKNKGLRKSKPGPKPDKILIEGDWEDAISTALQKKRPESGWPDHEKPKEKDGE